ncbi:uncharacterized protein EI90DRAFT_2286190 [Cantharellus anzutake]|uniref:uncharacterized protein n=1 Tax=Cantharellus anzutake TaxID=1750568 RepID=UPI001902D10C|nr:uncharacterized protein EI90DRAFT_2286190 [Cantharellus anzutake]KAF8339800.1 hypothetical protein EI90DRAFT_2286190 [Cantharellus anzutake]
MTIMAVQTFEIGWPDANAAALPTTIHSSDFIAFVRMVLGQLPVLKGSNRHGQPNEKWRTLTGMSSNVLFLLQQVYSLDLVLFALDIYGSRWYTQLAEIGTISENCTSFRYYRRDRSGSNQIYICARSCTHFVSSSKQFALNLFDPQAPYSECGLILG